jgi:hypothetical protein
MTPVTCKFPVSKWLEEEHTSCITEGGKDSYEGHDETDIEIADVIVGRVRKCVRIQGRVDRVGEGDEGNEEGWESVRIEEIVHVGVFKWFADVSMVINSQKKTEG